MKRVLGVMLFCLVEAMSCCSIVAAAADISHSFLLAPGAAAAPGQLISTVGGGQEVVLADTSNGARLTGIVLPSASNNSLLAVDSSTGLSKVQVALDGTVSAYVSTLNGDIHAGDVIGVSPLSGLGMKAEGAERIIGVAQADFTSKSAGARVDSISDKSGHSQQIFIGSIPVTIGIGNSPAASGSQSGIVGNLQSVAATIVGHQVSVFRVALSFLVTIIAIGALIALVYGAIHGGIVAIGRNPLARESIYKSLVGAMVMALLIVLLAIAILYFTLR